MPRASKKSSKKPSKGTELSATASTTKKSKVTQSDTPTNWDAEPADQPPTWAPFSHSLAFSRTLGVLSLREQGIFANATIAIAGVGGAGSAHALALARSGIGNFRVADLDQYEVGNFNRQMGATMSNVGRDKVAVMTEMMKDINPNAKFSLFNGGINEDNIDEFLDGVDVCVDAIDFFAPRARKVLYDGTRRHGIPTIIAIPVGMGASVIVFHPKGMSFEEYTGITDACDDVEQCVRFMVGFLPKVLHRSSLIEPARLNIAQRIAPSHVSGIFITSGILSTEVNKLLTGRGKPVMAPQVIQFDAYSGRAVLTKGAHTAWWRKFRANMALKQIRASLPLSYALAEPKDISDDIEYIMDAARWAPSMNNRQGWHFVREGAVTVRVVCSAPAGVVLRQRSGALVLQELGGLLEVARSAATQRHRVPWYKIETATTDAGEVSLVMIFRPASKSTSVDAGPSGFHMLPADSNDVEWTKYIRRRRTQYGPVSKEPLFPEVLEQATEAAAALGVTLGVHTSRSTISTIAKANDTAAKVQRTLDGPIDDHLIRDEDLPSVGVPRAAVPRSSASTKCAAYLTLALAPGVEWSNDAVLRGGAALLRVWLILTGHWVEAQPVAAGVALSWAHLDGTKVSKDDSLCAKVATVANHLTKVCQGAGSDLASTLITLRVGKVTKEPKVRALRKPLSELWTR